MVYLHVYRLEESKFGFYHSGLEYLGVEYTFCANIGICYHPPKKCTFAKHLGVVRLGTIQMEEEEFKEILRGEIFALSGSPKSQSKSFLGVLRWSQS